MSRPHTYGYRPDQPAEILHREGCSCVIATRHGRILLCHERGIKDLHRLLHEDPQSLSGASVADKVIGKGAAALMIAGGVRWVYADVISEGALGLLRGASVDVTFGRCVAAIINRAGTGICPVESLCKDCVTAEECIPLIDGFVRSIAAIRTDK